MNLDGEIGVRHGYTPPAIGSFLEEILVSRGDG
jgi:hypothetical protein